MAVPDKPGTTQPPLHRLVRTLSGKAASAQPVSPLLSSTVIPPSVSEDPSTSVSVADTPTSGPSRTSAPSRQKAQLVGVIDRFKNLNLGGEFKKPKSDITLEVDPTESPPTHHAETGTPADIPIYISTNAYPPIESTEPSEPDIPPTDEHAEPTFLARKIQALIDALPLPTSPATPRAPSAPRPPKRDATGRPIPPAEATPIEDSGLIAMLSSATIMNGSSSSRPSVWSILESLGGPRHDPLPGSDGAEDGNGVERGDEVEGEHEEADDNNDIFSDGSSIMMYSPLLPTQSSLVELADLEVVPLPTEGGEESPTQDVPEISATGLSAWMSMWPFTVWGGKGLGGGEADAPEKKDEAPPPYSPQSTPGPSNLPLSPTIRGGSQLPRMKKESRNGNENHPRFQAQGQRVWVPSTTKLSLQAMWWGYRLYLPPAVLEVLSDKQLEATKRAAMITAALTWFFGHLPISSLPPAVRPALLLLQTLVPYVGYIGTFISWSWGTVKSYDKGHGVILTATWLLPVALIPGTWEEHDVPPASPAPANPPSLPQPSPAPVPAPPSAPTQPTSLISSAPPQPAPSQPAPPPSPCPPTPAQPHPIPESPVPAPPQGQPLPISAPEPGPPLPPAPPRLPTSPLPPPAPTPPTIPLPEVDAIPVSPDIAPLDLVLGKSTRWGEEEAGEKSRDRDGGGGGRGKRRDKMRERGKVVASFLGLKRGDSGSPRV